MTGTIEWRKIEDTPDIRQRVFDLGRALMAAPYKKMSDDRTFWEIDIISLDEICDDDGFETHYTHWAPLPLPPSEGEE